MTRDPLSNALRNAAAKYEASYSKTGAHADPGLATRARRRRVGTIAIVSALSLGMLVASGSATAYIFGRDSDSMTDPITPPIPDGYERIVISLPDERGLTSIVDSSDSVLDALTEEGACGAPLPDLADNGPFTLEIASVHLPLPEGMSYTEYREENESAPIDFMVSANLQYDGHTHDSVSVKRLYWVLLRDDGTLVQSVRSWFSWPDTNRGGWYSLDDPFSTIFTDSIPPADCAKQAASPENGDSSYAEGVLVDPGSYSLVGIARVEWSAEATVVHGAESLGYDPAWFNDGWRESIPCRDQVENIQITQDVIALECAPNLYILQMFSPGSQGDDGRGYALVDVPRAFFSSPQKTWYVVSEPYPVEWTGEAVSATP